MLINVTGKYKDYMYLSKVYNLIYVFQGKPTSITKIFAGINKSLIKIELPTRKKYIGVIHYVNNRSVFPYFLLCLFSPL